MYPQNFFSLIPAFPRKPQAFVAMSFDRRFNARWNDVLAPALENLKQGKTRFRAVRVDLSKASDAILTEILQGIGESAVIVADITATAELDGRAVRNSNVLYEVGIAHAVRLPEEVVLFRSDSLRLDFDIAGVRVHAYDPDGDPAGSRKLVTETVLASLNALDARKRTVLRATAERLTSPAVMLLFTATMEGRILHPVVRNMGQALSSIETTQAIQVLLEVGAIRANLLRLTPELLAGGQNSTLLQKSEIMMDYVPTALGNALLDHLGMEMGIADPALQPYLEKLLESETPAGSPTDIREPLNGTPASEG